MTPAMSTLMTRLLEVKKVAVIGGGKYEVFQELFLKQLKCEPKFLKKLFLFPTTATAFYQYGEKGWDLVYSLFLSTTEVDNIKRAFEDVFKEIGYKHPSKTYGEIIENRGTQVSFSVYGQDLVSVLGQEGVRMKERWLKDNLETKMKIAKLVAQKLPDLEVRAAGFTTIDVTKKGIDKAFGIYQMEKYLKIPISKMLFMGDAMFKGGNDYPVIKTGIDYIAIKGPEETAKILESLLE
jgi:HAD superfamily hydrolase (TIGR01484 family)